MELQEVFPDHAVNKWLGHPGIPLNWLRNIRGQQLITALLPVPLSLAI
jgi:hypothetical protein